MKKTRLFILQSGQTLVEAIVVIGMVMLLVTGLISGTTASLKSSQSGKARSDATKSAQDGMEIIRLIRDNNWTTVTSHANGLTYCLESDGTIIGGSCDGNIKTVDTKLTRTVVFTWLPDNINPNTTIDVHVTVSYQEGESTKTVSLDTYLTQWK